MADALNLQPGEIEVFRGGDYPQGKWPPERVAKAAANYDPVNKHRAYIKAGHKDGGMAYGLFDKMRAVGASLIGKLADTVPQPVKDAFAQGQISGWSSEFYTDYDGTGEPYFKALALLGATPPQVKGLKSAIDFHEPPDHGEVEAFDMNAGPYAPSALADVLKADETRRELSDIQWAFSRETEKVMCANDLDASQKRAELNRLANELASLTEAEVSTYNEEDDVADPKNPAAPEKPAAPPAPAAPTGDATKFAEMEAQFAELKATNAKLAAKTEAQDKLIEDLGKGVVRGKIASFSEQAAKDGKLTKGDVEAGVAAFMEAIEPVFFEVAKTDKDGKALEPEKVSALAWFQEHVSKRVTAVPNGVTSKGAKGVAPNTRPGKPIEGADPDSVQFSEEVDSYAEEHKIPWTQAYKKLAAERVSA